MVRRAAAAAAMFFWALSGLCSAEEPRYVAVNIAHYSGRLRPETKADFEAQLREVRDKLGPDTSSLRIAVSYIFSLLEAPEEELTRGLRALLAASEATGVPILVTFDGQNWWEARPDLWNWWDPGRPGYDPANAQNVEWTGWDPSKAVKIGWRNWGRQLRVAPAQNIASPRVLDATLAPLRTLAAVVAQWARALPDDRRHLFAGVKVGWEASIGYNAFYYPDGNRYADEWPDDESHDPTHGLDLSRNLSGGLAQLGYAAVKTLGVKHSGEITRDDIGKVTQHYLSLLARTAHDAGIPRDLVYTHQGGTLEPYPTHLPYSAAFNEWSRPGWSIYWKGPADAGPLGEALDQSGHRRWAVSEWLWPGENASVWEDHLRQTLDFRDCRFVCIYNWEGIENDEAACEGLRRLLRGSRIDAALDAAAWHVTEVAAGSEEATEAGLGVESTQERDSGLRTFAGAVTDTTAGERAVTLALCIPLDAMGWTWWDDPERRRTIEGSEPYSNVVASYFAYDYLGSQYPLAVISDGEHALCIAVPLDPPRIPRFVYDPARKELRAEFDFGLSPIPAAFPSRAAAAVLAFEVPAQWAFRRALERYYALHPEAFQKRTHIGGTLLTKTPIDSIERPEDFGFAWHDFPSTVPEYAEADERGGVLSFIYREPQTNWRELRGDAPRAYDNFLAQLREDAGGGDRKAQGTLLSGVERADGRLDLYLDPIPWASAAPFGTNADPAVLKNDKPGWPNKGEYELEDLGEALGWNGAASRFDGVFFDSMEGWTNLLNYRRDHWRTTQYPLTFDRADGNRVCLSNLWGNYAFAKALSAGLRQHNQLLIGNGAFHFLWVFAPFVDIPGREYNWHVDGRWTPLPEERFLFLRAMAYQRPCWVLMNDPFDDPAHLEEYFQRCLFYGVFPSMFHAHTGASYAYFAHPEYYNRDRPLFVQYVPLIRRLHEAGWQPVPHATAEPATIRIERYGNRLFTLHNPTGVEQPVTLRLHRAPLGLPENPRAEELLANRPLTFDNTPHEFLLHITLPPNAYAALSLTPP